MGPCHLTQSGGLCRPEQTSCLLGLSPGCCSHSPIPTLLRLVTGLTDLSGLTCAGGIPASFSLALLFSSLGSSPAYLLCAWPTREQGDACISPCIEAAQMGRSTRAAFAWPQTCCVTQGSCFTSLSLSFLVYTMVSHPCVHIAILNCDEGLMIV